MDNRILELGIELGRIAREELGEEESLSKAAVKVLKSLSADTIAILTYDPGFRSAYVAASLGKGDVLMIQNDITLRVKEGSSLAHAAAHPDKPLILTKDSGDTVLGPAGDMTVVVAPMVYAGKVYGFLLLGSADRATLLQNDADLVMAISSHLALLTGAAALLRLLSESEDRYRMLTESTAGLAFVLDQGGRFLYVNHRAKDVLGYESHDMVGRYFGEFVTAESWAKTTATLKEAVSRQAKYATYQWVVRREDGKETVLDIEASLSYQDSELHRHQGIATDSSVERQLKEELQKTGRELSAVRSREERMREFLFVANTAQEQERARIARDIHDGAIQYLVGMRRRLDLLRKDLLRKNTGSDASLSELDDLLDKATSDLRQFARNLRPPVLDDFGLVSACEWLADQTSKEGIRVVFSPSGEIRRLPPDVEISTFRIVQEALSNVVKHSGATLTEVTLDFGSDVIRISVSDNGVGFVVEESTGSLGRAGQMGLVGMFERAELMGASMEITSEPGEGTHLEVSIPVKENPAKG